MAEYWLTGPPFVRRCEHWSRLERSLWVRTLSLSQNNASTWSERKGHGGIVFDLSHRVPPPPTPRDRTGLTVHVREHVWKHRGRRETCNESPLAGQRVAAGRLVSIHQEVSRGTIWRGEHYSSAYQHDTSLNGVSSLFIFFPRSSTTDLVKTACWWKRKAHVLSHTCYIDDWKEQQRHARRKYPVRMWNASWINNDCIAKDKLISVDWLMCEYNQWPVTFIKVAANQQAWIKYYAVAKWLKY